MGCPAQFETIHTFHELQNAEVKQHGNRSGSETHRQTGQSHPEQLVPVHHKAPRWDDVAARPSLQEMISASQPDSSV